MEERLNNRTYKMSLKRILILLVVISNILYSQNYKSIHQTEWELHKNSVTHPSLTGDQSKDLIFLNVRKDSLDAAVFGYLPYWASSDYLQYSLLSHIAVFGVSVNKYGQITNSHNWPWTALINKAHAHGVKIILTAVLFDGDDIHTLITTQSYKDAFFTNIKNAILQGNADGVNIDFESLNNADKGANIVNFMHELTIYLHNEIPGSEISFAGPAVNWGSYWDLVGLANACDYIFIMGYAFAGSWNTSTGAMAPLIGGSINITNTINTQYGSVTQNSPQKLILGIPYYGYHWKTSSGQPRATITDAIGSVFYESYQQGAATYNYFWDTQSQTPWYRYNDGDDWHQIWCDDDSSLGLKYQIAENWNLKGVGMWALGYDGQRMELWQELYNHFGSGLMPPPNAPEALSVQIEDEYSLKVNFSSSGFANHYFVCLSSDGLIFEDSIQVSSTSTIISGLTTDSLYFVRVRAANDSAISQPTEVLAGIPSSVENRVLIVNGFDRQNGVNSLRNYIRQHAYSIKRRGYAISSASNEAIISEQIQLNDYEIVDWISGDESTVDETFNFKEQSEIVNYLEAGGYLFISGSEIGWDLSHKGYTADKQFYADYFKAQYIADAPLGQSSTHYSVAPVAGGIFSGLPAFNFDDGSHGTYNVSWPDAITAIDGGINCLQYNGVSSSNGVAGIAYKGTFSESATSGKLVYLAFPFETVYPESARDTLMSRIFDFFESVSNSINEETLKPQKFTLYQNYPNPFNSLTIINFYIPQKGVINIKIFDILGREIYKWSDAYSHAGEYKHTWHGENSGGLQVNSGTYFLNISFNENNVEFSRNQKLLYLK